MGRKPSVGVVACGLCALLLLLPRVSSADAETAINDSLAAAAHVWIDGVPLLPPYTLEVRGDTAFVVNGVPAVAFATGSGAAKTPAREDMLRDRAYSAMRQARDAGLPDSAVAAVGCAVFNEDTTALGVASVRPDGHGIELVRRHSDGAIADQIWAMLPGPTAEAKTVETRGERLERYRRLVDGAIQRDDYIFLCHQGAGWAAVSASRKQVLIRDIRDAALSDSIDGRAWFATEGEQHRCLDPREAKAISAHTRWMGR